MLEEAEESRERSALMLGSGCCCCMGRIGDGVAGMEAAMVSCGIRGVWRIG